MGRLEGGRFIPLWRRGGCDGAELLSAISESLRSSLRSRSSRFAICGSRVYLVICRPSCCRFAIHINLRICVSVRFLSVVVLGSSKGT